MRTEISCGPKEKCLLGFHAFSKNTDRECSCDVVVVLNTQLVVVLFF